MARKIVVTSGKGGVGKTTVCCNTAVQLARRGNRVLVADFDFGLNNVDVVLGVENLSTYNLLDAVEGNCRARQAIYRHPRYPTLYTLSSNRVSEKYISPQSVRLVIESLAPQFDFIFLDSPAGIGEGFHRAASCADEALLVTTPNISAMRDADRVSGLLHSYRLGNIGLVVNLMKAELAKKGTVFTPEDISSALRLPVRAVIPEDDRLFLAGVTERSRAFRLLTDALLLTEETEKRHGIFAAWGRK